MPVCRQSGLKLFTSENGHRSSFFEGRIRVFQKHRKILHHNSFIVNRILRIDLRYTIYDPRLPYLQCHNRKYHTQNRYYPEPRNYLAFVIS